MSSCLNDIKSKHQCRNICSIEEVGRKKVLGIMNDNVKNIKGV